MAVVVLPQHTCTSPLALSTSSSSSSSSWGSYSSDTCSRRLLNFPIKHINIRRNNNIKISPILLCKIEPDPDPDEEEDEQVHNDIGVQAALSTLRFYKREISPLLPKSCRYVPTCSEYSMIAYKKYGFVKGSVLTAWRICRCNPLGGSGFDPPRWFDEERVSQEEDL